MFSWLIFILYFNRLGLWLKTNFSKFFYFSLKSTFTLLTIYIHSKIKSESLPYVLNETCGKIVRCKIKWIKIFVYTCTLSYSFEWPLLFLFIWSVSFRCSSYYLTAVQTVDVLWFVWLVSVRNVDILWLVLCLLTSENEVSIFGIFSKFFVYYNLWWLIIL